MLQKRHPLICHSLANSVQGISCCTIILLITWRGLEHVRRLKKGYCNGRKPIHIMRKYPMIKLSWLLYGYITDNYYNMKNPPNVISNVYSDMKLRHNCSWRRISTMKPCQYRHNSFTFILVLYIMWCKHPLHKYIRFLSEIYVFDSYICRITHIVWVNIT